VLGEKRVEAVAIEPRLPLDDRKVCEALHAMLSSADVVIAHNGDRFDLPFVRGRMLIHGLPPLPPIVSVDTLKLARKHYLLNANSLDYLGKLLRVGGKRATPKGLWLRVLQGDKAAICAMVAYCREDVRLLERVFLKLRQHAAATHLHRGEKGRCPRCGSRRIQARGIHRTARGRGYARWQCGECGGWWRNARALDRATSSMVL
jgi:DNA polymerase III epsilon subunit-like protein